jgi:hypothetical protein
MISTPLRQCCDNLHTFTLQSDNRHVREDVVFHFPMGRRTLTSESIRHTGPKRCESSSRSFHFPLLSEWFRESKRTPSHPEKPLKKPDHAHTVNRLAGPCLHLGCGTLGTLLADLCGLASRGGGGALGLLGLLL